MRIMCSLASQILLFVRDGVCNNEYEFCVLEYHEDVIRNLSANRVSCADFKELLPVIGDRVAWCVEAIGRMKMVCTYEGIEADNLQCVTSYGCFFCFFSLGHYLVKSCFSSEISKYGMRAGGSLPLPII